MKLLRLITSSVSYGLIKGQLRYLSSQGMEVIGVSGLPQDRAKDAAAQEGIRTVLIPHLTRPIRPLKDIRALIAIIKLILQERPDIVHANTPKASLLGMIGAWLCRVPHRIYTVTGLRFETATGLLRFLLIMVERITCACATKVIPEGDGVAATLRKERITQKPLQKIFNGNINGIDLHYFDSTPELMSRAAAIRRQIGTKDSFFFVFVGRLVRDKGLVELVEAFLRILSIHSDVRLILVGNYEEDLDPLPITIIQGIKNSSAIYEAGYQQDVRPWFLAADALAFASYREGFPNVVMQAGAMQLPSIVTDISGCNEIVLDGFNGLIVPPRDTESLYMAMVYLFANKEKRQEMAQNARPMIVNRYEQSKVWDALFEMYQHL